MVEKLNEENPMSDRTRRFWIQKLTSSQFTRHSTELTEALLSAAIQALRLADERIPHPALLEYAFPDIGFELGCGTLYEPAPPRKGIVISDTNQTRERLEKDDKFWYLKMKIILLSAPVEGNISRLNEKMNHLMQWGYRIRGVEAKINAVLTESNRGGNFNAGDGTRSFFEWLKVFDRSDYDWDFVNAIKAVAADYGIKLTRLLVELMLITSDTADEEGLKKFRALRATLKWIIEGENSIVIHRVLAALDTVEGEIKKKKDGKNNKKPKKDKGKGKAVMVEEEEQKGTGITEELIEDVSGTPILLLFNLILAMELFWMHRTFTDSVEQFSATFSAMEVEVDEFLVKLKMIETEVRELRELSAFNFEDGDQRLMETALFANIDELWDRIEDSKFE